VLGWPRSATGAGWKAPRRADGPVPLVSRRGGRKGMEEPRPLDQVVIDGSRPSPTSSHGGRGGNPSWVGGSQWLTYGCSPATTTGRGDAALQGELGEGRNIRS
jgi:hypothetical protein